MGNSHDKTSGTVTATAGAESSSACENIDEPNHTSAEGRANNLADSFAMLFPGYEHAHGRFHIKSENDRGKVQGKALTLHTPATQVEWDIHLAGTDAGLGIIPLMDDNTVWWAVIDIDVIGINHAALETKINELKLPLVVCRSKSGGAHCFLFMSEPTPATDVRNALEAWAAALGHGGCEIFPKQTSRYNETDIGNWLNMPYYHVDKTIRYGFRNGKPVTDPMEWVEYAASHRITLSQLGAVEVVVQNPKSSSTNNEGPFKDGPPCLQTLCANGGFPEGTRNEGMYNVAVYLRRAYPDDWQTKIMKYNVDMADPALSISEINTLTKSVTRKDYAYRCKQPPINSYCHKSLCLKRNFGVGEMAEGGGRPEIGHLVKHEGDPVIWFADIDGRRIMFTTPELLSQNQFKQKVLEAINRVPPTMTQPRWDRYIDEKVRGCDVVEVPEDASPTGQFKILVEQYLTGMAQATSKKELAIRLTPYLTGDGEVWFRSRGLFDYLTIHIFRYKSEHHVWQMLRGMGAENQSINVSGKVFNVWVMPAPTTIPEPPLPKFGTEEF